ESLLFLQTIFTAHTPVGDTSVFPHFWMGSTGVRWKDVGVDQLYYAAAVIGAALAINQRRPRGVRNHIASNAATQSNANANQKIGYERPVLHAIKLPIGTSNDAVPLAVYSKP